MSNKLSAENGFSKGMVLDANPLNQNENTLTSCLNGTTVTYNGNEFVLQNDMGNGRIENVYLQKGYIPLGVKEYGGIVYIVSYNPETNKSLIGSFPSPANTISSIQDSKMNEINIYNELEFTGDKGLSKFKFNKSFKEDFILRPGDKFSLLIKKDSLSNLINYISEFNTKKQLFSLKIVVTDEKGTYNDITNLLLKFNNLIDNNIINTFFEISLNDSSKIDDIRSKKINVYKEKLVGNLQFVIELNSLSDFEIEIFGEKTSNSDNLLHFYTKFKSDTFEGNEEYNYLKGLKLEIEKENEKLKYYKYFEITPNNDDKFSKNNNNFNFNFNITDLNNDEKFKYILTPIMEYGYLDAMKKSGWINVSKFGSGEIELSEWRYFNDLNNDTLYLNWGLNTYLKSNQKINLVTFKFNKILNNSILSPIEKIISDKSYYHGNFSEVYHYDELDKNSLYIVEIIVEKETNGNKENISFFRFLFTSNYFNLYYISENDYDNLKLNNINILSNHTLELSNYTVEEEINKESEKIYNNKISNFNYKINQKHKSELLLHSEYTLENDLLPFSINTNLIETKLKNDVNINNIIDDIDVYSSNNSNSGYEYLEKSVPNNLNNELGYTYSKTDNSIILNYKLTSEFKSISEENKTYISDQYSLRPYISTNPKANSDIFGYTISKYPLYGFATSFRNHDRNPDPFYFLVDYGSNNYSKDDTPNELCKLNLTLNNNNIPLSTVFLELDASWRNVFGKQGPSICFWIYKTPSLEPGGLRYYTNTGDKKTDTNYVLVLWKDSYGNYNLLNEVYTKNGISGYERLYNIFSNIYVRKKIPYEGVFYKSDQNNYSYTRSYNIKYNLNIGVNSVVNGDILNLNLIKNTIKKYEGKINMNNITLETNPFVINNLSLNYKGELKNKDISNIVQDYINASPKDFGLVLIDNNNNIHYNDGNGNKFKENEIYYFGNDKKIYNINTITNNSGNNIWNNSILSTKISSLNIIKDNFEIGNDDILYIKPNTKYIVPTIKDYPNMGEYDDGKRDTMFFGLTSGTTLKDITFATTDVKLTQESPK